FRFDAAAFLERREADAPQLGQASLIRLRVSWISLAPNPVHVRHGRTLVTRAHFGLELPADNGRPAVLRFHGATHTFHIEEKLTASLRALSKAQGVTLFTTMMAAFNVLLTRYTGRRDIVLGVPTTMRTDERLERVVGLLVNTLPLRTELPGGARFSDVLGMVHGSVADAFDNGDVPFERLVQELGVERELGYSPVVQVVFGMTEAGSGIRELGEARLTEVFVDRGTAKFDLTWSVSAGERLTVEIEYNTDMFDAGRVARMAEHYVQVLSGVLERVDRPIGDIDLIGETDRMLLSPMWTEHEQPRPEPLHTLFSHQARRNPHGVALVDGDRSVTYRELEAHADRLARRLRKGGVGPDKIVGVCAPPSVELIVALLAVVKAGGAYLPIDPQYPVARQRFLLQDTNACLVVVSEGVLDQLPDGPWESVTVDLEDESHPVTAPAGTTSPDDLAYVIHTSGSTGAPKGVGVSHRNVARLLSATRERFGFDEHDVWTLFHSHAFDFSVWEIWGALCTGGRLVIVPRSVTRSPHEFRALLSSEQVTVLNQTPSAFRSLELADAEAATGKDLALRLVIFGGEALDLPSVGRWFARHGDSAPELVNMYGITETTVHVTYRRLTEADVRLRRSPIGAPIPDLRVYVVDSWGGLAPAGIPGELYVGGAGIAQGYLGRPGLTAESFIPDPFGQEPGARLYRTGDLGRCTSDGELEYLGRRDEQVKIRGFRIELGEVEAALAAHPDVTAAAVVADHEDGTSPRLVAYVASEESLTTSRLREFVGERLPAHMIPSLFVTLGEIPLTSNGKLDRIRLPKPGGARPELESAFEEPEGELERELAEIWAEVLGIDTVG
ncbi:non-ribosomal peptide synthetase, partial [Amycolatopsis lurida]|uniref:non-ribosomal peptide synthetase n=1 Tax=Amycolatopsis lurida TaxID=31959 RepID=UPI00364715DB